MSVSLVGPCTCTVGIGVSEIATIKTKSRCIEGRYEGVVNISAVTKIMDAFHPLYKEYVTR